MKAIDALPGLRIAELPTGGLALLKCRTALPSQTLFGDWQVALLMEITPDEIEAFMRVHVAEQWKAFAVASGGTRVKCVASSSPQAHRNTAPGFTLRLHLATTCET